MTETEHEVHEAYRQTLELIQERLHRDQRAIAAQQERYNAELTGAYEAMEQRCSEHLQRLAATLGIQVPDGALVEANVEKWTLTVRSGKPGEAEADA